MMYNNKCQMLPSNLVATQFNFKEAEFFEIAKKAKEVPEVKF
jgi:LemA protein